MIAVRVLGFVAGAAIVCVVIDAAVRTFVLPRGAGVKLSRAIARTVRAFFNLLARPSRGYEGRDRVMAMYGPVTLLSFAVVWLGGTLLGYTLMFAAVNGGSWRDALRLSGSALLTLGFAVPPNGASVVLVFTEAAIGLILVALLIAYLPTIYGAFSRREAMVTQLSVRAGTPPTPGELLVRAHRAQLMDQLDLLFTQWELWFVELEETHSSFAMLAFFRSPNPGRSWVTAAGGILDTAAIRMSAMELPFNPNAGICIRAGYVALRSVAHMFDLPHDADPAPGDPISITREEFLDVFDALAAEGLPMRADREQAWRDFAGWRVNYDAVLIGLAGMVMAPYAPWTSDRSITRQWERALARRGRRSR